MMRLQDIITKDLRNVKHSKTKNVELCTALEIIVGEMQRQKDKILTNETVVKILKSLQKNEEKVLKKLSRDRSSLLEITKEYQEISKSIDIRRNFDENR